MVTALFGGGGNTLSADYKSAGSHQIENNKYQTIATPDTWETIYTVPEGKTFYVTTLIFTAVGATWTNQIGIADTIIISILHTIGGTIILDLKVPIRFDGGTTIQHRSNAGTPEVTLVGWEE